MVSDDGELVSCAILGQISDQRVPGDTDCSKNLRYAHTQSAGATKKGLKPIHEAYIICQGHTKHRVPGMKFEMQRMIRVIPYISYMLSTLIAANEGAPISESKKELTALSPSLSLFFLRIRV